MTTLSEIRKVLQKTTSYCDVKTKAIVTEKNFIVLYPSLTPCIKGDIDLNEKVLCVFGCGSNDIIILYEERLKSLLPEFLILCME